MTNHRQYNLEPKPLTPQQSFGQDSPNVLRLDKTLNVKNQFILNDKEFINKLGQTFGRTGISTLITGATYSVSASEYLIGVTSLSYAPTIGLPRPLDVGVGKNYIIKDEAGGAASTTITVVSTGYETIDGGASTTITTNYASKSFYTDGANWFIY